MREIKFRFWDEKYNQWDTSPLTIYHGESVVKQGRVIQQFTGFKDKNGKEIYEGDIVEYYLDNTFRDEIKWYNFGFVLSSIESGGEAPLCQALEYEIVGNIFENPIL